MRSLLYNRNFAALFAGRLVTNAGDSLYFVAAMWLVLELTGSDFYTGLAGFLVLAPAALQVLAGPLVDRFPLRRLLVSTQLLQGALILVIPAAHLTGHLSVWVVLVVMPLLSLLNQLVYPAETAALPRVVEDDELVPANSLFAVAYQGVDAVFNGLAGLLIVAVGAMAVFTFDAVTFALAAGLFATLSIRGTASDEPAAVGPADATDPTALPDGGEDVPEPSGSRAALAAYLADLREGVDYLRGTVLALMIGGTLVINFTLGAVTATLPSYGKLMGGPEAYGFLTAAIAAGILLGALLAGPFGRFRFGRLGIAAFAFSGVVWLAAIGIDWLPATAALLLFAFVPVGVTNVLVVSMVQSVVPAELLGRVGAVLGSLSALTVPFGSLAGGTVAEFLGPTPVMVAAGVAFVFLAAYVLAIPDLRRMPAVGDVETLAAN